MESPAFPNTGSHRLLRFAAGSALACLALGISGTARGAEGMTLVKDIKPLLQEYCLDCHNPQKLKGDFDLTPLLDNAKLHEHRDAWEKVIETIEAGDMPPEKKPQPTQDQRTALVHFVDGELSKATCEADQDPGRVTIRRLNKQEFKNTIRDLLKVEYDPKDFPNDEVGYGFDNIGDVLSLSPMLMEKFMDAAEEIASKAIVTDPNLKPPVRKFKGSEFKWTGDDELIVLSNKGAAVRSLELPAAGEYTLRVWAYGDQAGTEPVKMAVMVAGQEVEVFDVAAKGRPAKYEAKFTGKKGWQEIGVAFQNDYFDDKNPDEKLRGDRNLYIATLELELPAGPDSLPESHRRLITETPEAGQERAAATRILGKFAKRAYRRPVSAAEVERLVRFVDLALANKGTFLEGIQLAVQAVLSSPQFLFRWELDPTGMAPGTERELNDYEVASRLSYFLWNSMPDEALTELADKGELRKNGNLEKQVTRMLKDYRARTLAINFAGQWLQIRNIWEVAPDPNIFPQWKDEYKWMMKEETERFFEAIMREDRSIVDLLDADFTFLNGKLAKFYGIPGVEGDNWRRVTFPADSPRGGVLTQASVLLSTSTPTRTAPVIRGKWILEQILGTPPPPPPPDVPPLNEQGSVDQSAPLRKRLEAHMSNIECSGCHKRMDPLGFALENFDATGAFRAMDGKFPIDASGKLPDGRKFSGPKELKAILKSGDGFATNFVEKMFTYALGRGLDYRDHCTVEGLVKKLPEHGNRFSAVIAGIVTSEPFLKRKAPETVASL